MHAKSKLNIRVSEQMPTRPCEYCLALEDDSVFLDLDIRENGNLFVVRISFDGYGCCEPVEVTDFNESESKFLINNIKNNTLSSSEVAMILRSYLKINKDSLWTEALSQYNLI